MKSRQLLWLLLIFCFNLPTNAYTFTEPVMAQKKVFILLRTEQNPQALNKFKSIVESNLQHNNLSTQIKTYRVSEPIPQIKIFKDAYQQNFDYILLIDQVANYNVGLSNKKVHVGGKFKIQSYNLKSNNPCWTNLGNANCNTSVLKSIQQFSHQIIQSISSDKNMQLVAASNFNSNLNGLTDDFKSKEIKLLKSQIYLQKAKTKHVLSEMELLTLKSEKELELEIQKNKNLALEIEKFK